MAAGEGICPEIKPLLDTVVREASHILQMSEALGSGHPDLGMPQGHTPGSSSHVFHGHSNFKKCLGSQKPHHISPQNASLLSEMETLKRELHDIQHKHQIIADELHRAGESHSVNLDLSLQQDQSQEKMQLIGQNLLVSKGNALNFNQYLCSTDDQTAKDRKEVFSSVAVVKPCKPKIDQIAGDNMQILHHAVETPEINNKVKEMTILKMQLKLSQKEVISLQTELKTSTLKAKALQEHLFNADQKIQSLQEKLITTNDKAIDLEEALRASDEARQSLRTSLQERETEACTAKEQLQILQEHNLEHQRTIKKMSSSLEASEELYRKRLPELETGLKDYKMQVEFLQDTLRGAEFTHRQEMEELSSEMEKQTVHLQYLQSQVLDLSNKYLKEKQRVRKILGGPFAHEECVHNHMQEARHSDMNDHQADAITNVNRRGQAGTTNYNHHHGVHGSRYEFGQGQGECFLQARLSSLQQELVKLRGNLHEVFQHSSAQEDQKRLDWMKVLERSQEWEERAGKLMDSMLHIHNHQRSESKRSPSDPADVTERPFSYTNCPDVMSKKQNIRTHSGSWNCPMPDMEQCKQYQFHSPNETRPSDSLNHLPRQQKHFMDAQTASFLMDTQGSLRMS